MKPSWDGLTSEEMIWMATLIWMSVTLCLFAFVAIGVVVPTLALRRAEEQLVPVLVATNTRQYELRHQQ
jgi:hypothetical protein